MTRPTKTRAWTKRDQREWLKKIPVMLCEPVQHLNGSHWLWRFWCPFCRTYHHHSPAPGSRSSHCTNRDSPLSTYLLELDPRFEILDRLCQCERREEAARKQRLAERRVAVARPSETSGQNTVDDANTNSSAEGDGYEH
jgi:hypothetical protein